MSDWTRVRWTEAAQVAEPFDWFKDLGGDGTAEPQAYFDGLRKKGRLSEAVQFLSQALPRYEVVTWSAQAVQRMGEGVELPVASERALRAALLWVQDPTDGRRRAALTAANAADDSAPERMAALAVFFSGGSVAPDGLPAVPPAKRVAGQMAAGAVILAAVRTGKLQASLAAALDAGDKIARGAGSGSEGRGKDGAS